MCSIDWHCVSEDLTSVWIADDHDDTSVSLYTIISDQSVLTWNDELGFKWTWLLITFTYSDIVCQWYILFCDSDTHNVLVHLSGQFLP